MANGNTYQDFTYNDSYYNNECEITYMIFTYCYK